MKVPTWEPSPGNLVAWLLNNQQATPVDLYTITLQSGTVLRYSGADTAVTVNGLTFALGPSMRRNRLSQVIGIRVSTMSLDVAATADDVFNSDENWLSAMAKGYLDGATVYLERGFFDDSLTCQGTVPVFYGRVGEVSAGRSGGKIEVRSHSELLDVMVPTDVFQPGCRNMLFDPICGLSKAASTFAGTTNAAADANNLTLTTTSAAIIALANGWANLGQIVFTSGPLTGTARTVRQHTVSGGVATIVLVYQTPGAWASGTTFNLIAGCNKVFAGDCLNKFNNQAKFRGEPFVPPPESVT